MAAIRVAFLIVFVAFALIPLVKTQYDGTTNDVLSTPNPSSDRSVGIFINYLIFAGFVSSFWSNWVFVLLPAIFNVRICFFFQFSIKSSNAPNPQFEWDAVQCLSEAYMLHPDSLDSITEAFGQLYKLKHAGNWRVNAGCTSLYVVTRNITIVVKVTEGTQETLITLYN